MVCQLSREEEEEKVIYLDNDGGRDRCKNKARERLYSVDVYT